MDYAEECTICKSRSTTIQEKQVSMIPESTDRKKYSNLLFLVLERYHERLQKSWSVWESERWEFEQNMPRKITQVMECMGDREMRIWIKYATKDYTSYGVYGRQRDENLKKRYHEDYTSHGVYGSQRDENLNKIYHERLHKSWSVWEPERWEFEQNISRKITQVIECMGVREMRIWIKCS